MFWAFLGWGLIGSRVVKEGSFEFDLLWCLQILAFGCSCLIAWRNHSRSRPYVWNEVFEEGDKLVFRRRGQELRISYEEVGQVAPAIAATGGLLGLRLQRGDPRESLVLFDPTSKKQDGLSVPEYLEQKAAHARRMRREKALETTPQSIRRERLSSSWTFVVKRLLPLAGFIGLAIWVVLSWGGMAASGEWSMLKVGAPLLVAVFGFILHHEYLSNLVDEIFNGENALSVRHLGREHRVPFSEVERLEYRPLTGFHWIVLHLKTPHPLGAKIAFIPDGRCSLFGWNPRLDALGERIAQA